MFLGTCKWFDRKKGYEFLRDDNGNDVFCHYSEIKNNGFKQLQEGDEVEFLLVQGSKGPKAANVMVLLK